MKTIEKYTDIDAVLSLIDKHSTAAIKMGLKFTVEWRTDGITEPQFSALHVWIRLCVDYLNNKRLYRCSPVTGKKILWTERAFKEDVYKVVLKALSDKDSTKKQNTVEPNDIRLAISGHMAAGYKDDVCLPDWPSLR